MMKAFATVLFFGLTSMGCNDNKSTIDNRAISIRDNAKSSIIADTSKSFKFDNLWITPISSLEINNVTRLGDDTISIVSCYEYFSNPFGQINNLKELKNSHLKEFSITDKKVKFHSNPTEYRTFQELSLLSNKLLIYFDKDSDAMPHSFIVEGVIDTPQVELEQSIRVGMAANNFYSTFFKSFPPSLINKYKVVAFKRCVDGDTEHFYTFTGDKLSKIEFATPH